MLKIEHLKKSYENFSLDCSLEVKKGHVTGLNYVERDTNAEKHLDLVQEKAQHLKLF